MTTVDRAALDRLRADIDLEVLPTRVASFIAEARDRTRQRRAPRWPGTYRLWSIRRTL